MMLLILLAIAILAGPVVALKCLLAYWLVAFVLMLVRA